MSCACVLYDYLPFHVLFIFPLGLVLYPHPPVWHNIYAECRKQGPDVLLPPSLSDYLFRNTSPFTISHQFSILSLYNFAASAILKPFPDIFCYDDCTQLLHYLSILFLQLDNTRTRTYGSTSPSDCSIALHMPQDEKEASFCCHCYLIGHEFVPLSCLSHSPWTKKSSSLNQEVHMTL